MKGIVATNFIYLFLSNLPINFGENDLDIKIQEVVKKLKNTPDKRKKQELGTSKGKLESLKRKIKDIRELIKQYKLVKEFMGKGKSLEPGHLDKKTLQKLAKKFGRKLF